MDFENQDLEPSVLEQRIKAIKEQYRKKIERLQSEMMNICTPLENLLKMKNDLNIIQYKIDENIPHSEQNSQLNNSLNDLSVSHPTKFFDSKNKSTNSNINNNAYVNKESSIKKANHTENGFYLKDSRKKSWSKQNLTKSPITRSIKNMNSSRIKNE